ncbi:MAG: hypothetical protein J6Y20_06610 [Lachnospiraceae bacterium]|nr:hypothetical protein [Lachnospiraceae bacterium]
MGDIIGRARALRGVIEGLAESLDDSAAAEAMELYPAWNGGGVSYTAGQRLRYGGKLYKVNPGQGHTSQEDWTPEAAVSLFAEILPGQDGTKVSVWQQPDSTNPYMTGDRVHFPTINDPIYRSTIDGNVWSPGDYPQGWEIEVEE